MVFDYFLLDAVDRDLVREGNNNLVMRADEIWVFGAVSDGVLAEIQIAKKTGKKLRYFEIQKPHKIIEIAEDQVMMEDEVKEFKSGKNKSPSYPEIAVLTPSMTPSH